MAAGTMRRSAFSVQHVCVCVCVLVEVYVNEEHNMMHEINACIRQLQYVAAVHIHAVFLPTHTPTTPSRAIDIGIHGIVVPMPHTHTQGSLAECTFYPHSQILNGEFGVITCRRHGTERAEKPH